MIWFVSYRYDLMQKCWSFSPEDRPTFSYLLQKLEQYKEICDNMSPDEIAQSSPTALDGRHRLHFTFLSGIYFTKQVTLLKNLYI